MFPFSIIVAVDENGGIGKNNSIPWYYKEDFQYFKKMTTNGVVIMGRKTYESIGKTLPNRVNIIVSRTMNENIEYTVCRTLKEALEEFCNQDKDVFVIGGEGLYREALEQYRELCQKVYITRIKGDYECDVKFPIEMLDENNGDVIYDCNEYYREEINPNDYLND